MPQQPWSLPRGSSQLLATIPIDPSGDPDGPLATGDDVGGVEMSFDSGWEIASGLLKATVSNFGNSRAYLDLTQLEAAAGITWDPSTMVAVVSATFGSTPVSAASSWKALATAGQLDASANYYANDTGVNGAENTYQRLNWIASAIEGAGVAGDYDQGAVIECASMNVEVAAITDIRFGAWVIVDQANGLVVEFEALEVRIYDVSP